jgi:hypothetical protein
MKTLSPNFVILKFGFLLTKLLKHQIISNPHQLLNPKL